MLITAEHRPGCEWCLKLLSTCLAPLVAQKEPDSPSFIHKDFPNDQANEANTPTEVREWLQKRGERVSEWNSREHQWRGGALERPEVCTEMHLARQRFIVTAHSFTGE
jgi:hypothetical protein